MKCLVIITSPHGTVLSLVPKRAQHDEFAAIEFNVSGWTGECRGTEFKTEVGKGKLLLKASSSVKKDTASLLQDATGGLGAEDKISDSYCNNCPMKLKFGEIRLLRCLI